MRRISLVLVVVGLCGLTGCTALLTGGKKRQKPTTTIEYQSTSPHIRDLRTEI